MRWREFIGLLAERRLPFHPEAPLLVRNKVISIT
jgi:hypothetical protein